VSRAAVRSRGVHGQSGQATVEWVALVLLAALVLGAAAAFAGRESDRGLGELVAKRIARGPGELALAGTAAPAPPVPVPRVSAPPAPVPRRADSPQALRGVGSVARHAWLPCLGYQRWRYERDHPLAAIEGLPFGEALGIVNDCLNPHSYLFED
jgi:hypothetical protein